MTDTATWYHGIRRPHSSPIVAAVDDAGHQVRLVRHHVKHSPDGFEWGYLGSGPAELARCLLIDAATHTPGADTGTAGDELPAHLPYQRFKELVVARWDSDEWRFSCAEARAWLTIYTPPDWEEVGREAFHNGEHGAPALNPIVRAHLTGLPVGEGGLEIMTAFSRGWTAANLAAPIPPD